MPPAQAPGAKTGGCSWRGLVIDVLGAAGYGLASGFPSLKAAARIWGIRLVVLHISGLSRQCLLRRRPPAASHSRLATTASYRPGQPGRRNRASGLPDTSSLGLPALALSLTFLAGTARRLPLSLARVSGLPARSRPDADLACGMPASPEPPPGLVILSGPMHSLTIQGVLSPPAPERF